MPHGGDRTLWLALGTIAVVVAVGLVAVPSRARSTGGQEGSAPMTRWPGSDDVTAVDDAAAFKGNLSGLAHASARTGSPAVLWAVQNGPGTLFRLVRVGNRWVTSAEERGGTRLRYPDGKGEVDAEGITLGSPEDRGIYVASERNERAKGSRNSILRYMPERSGRELRATHEWDLTRDLPQSPPNAGVEAIAWIPDSALTAARFVDEGTRAAYAPARYPEHGTGLLFVGLESNGMIYAFALNHVTMAFTRVAAIATGQRAVMSLEYDRDSGLLWAGCDDACGNRSATLAVDASGKFDVRRRYAPPTTLPNANNEGFAITSRAECVSGRKPVFWADDGDTRGHSIRTASLPCSAMAWAGGRD